MGKSQQQESEGAGHGAHTVKKQRVMNHSACFLHTLLHSPGPLSGEWRRPQGRMSSHFSEQNQGNSQQTFHDWYRESNCCHCHVPPHLRMNCRYSSELSAQISLSCQEVVFYQVFRHATRKATNAGGRGVGVESRKSPQLPIDRKQVTNLDPPPGAYKP